MKEETCPCERHDHMKVHEEVKACLHSFLILELHEDDRWASRTGRFGPGVTSPVPIQRQAGWTPEPIRLIRSRHNCLFHSENWATIPRTLDMHLSHYAEYTSAAKCLLHIKHSPSALHRTTNECCLG